MYYDEIRGDDPILPKQKIYFRGRLSSKFFELVLTEFDRLSKQGKISKASLARRIGCRPEQVTRWLAGPSNLTLSTISDLLLGMKCEPELSIRNLAEATAHDIQEPLKTVAGIAMGKKAR